MSLLDDILRFLKEYGTFKRTDIIPPFLVTATTTEKPLFEQQTVNEIPVFYVGIEVRSMGTASFVALGSPGYVNTRLISKSSYIEYQAPEKRYLDASNIMIVSDSNNAIVEVSGVYIDEP